MSTARRSMDYLKRLVGDHYLVIACNVIYSRTHVPNERFMYLSLVSVGFEYESCPDFILWEKRTAVLQGHETTASKLGGWSIDKHHALNIQSGESTTDPL